MALQEQRTMNGVLGDKYSGFTLALPTLAVVCDSYCCSWWPSIQLSQPTDRVGSPCKWNKQKNAYLIKHYLFLLIETIIRVTP